MIKLAHIMSQSSIIGVKALMYLRERPEEIVKSGAIAKNTGHPQAHVAKVLVWLCRAKIINSQRGPKGGVYITPAQIEGVSLAHVLEAANRPVRKRRDMLVPDCLACLHNDVYNTMLFSRWVSKSIGNM